MHEGRQEKPTRVEGRVSRRKKRDIDWSQKENWKGDLPEARKGWEMEKKEATVDGLTERSLLDRLDRRNFEKEGADLSEGGRGLKGGS